MSQGMQEDGNRPTVGELSRQLRDVLLRVTEVATKLEAQFVRKDLFEMNQLLLQNADSNNKTEIEALKQGLREAERGFVSREVVESLEKRIAELEDNNKWLMRLVVTFIILGVLTAVFAASGIQIGG